MTAYELIDTNLPLILKLMNNKLISPKMIEHIEIYENYHSMTGSKGDRYEELGKKYNKSSGHIRSIIYKLSKKI